MKKVLAGFIASLVFLAWAAFPYYTSSDVVGARVSKTERVTTSSESYYLIFTDKGVFKNVDDIRILKFGSSDLYGKIKEGQLYSFSTYGFRVPLLSWYPNIAKAL